MDLGLFHDWIRVLLWLSIPVICKLNLRWQDYKWLKNFALVQSLGWLTYTFLFSGNYQAYVLFRYIGYLTFLGAALEILHKDFKETPWWAIPAVLIILVSAIFTPPYGPYYFIPRALMFLGVAYYLSRAIKHWHFALIALSVFATGMITSDIFKLLYNAYEVFPFLRELDSLVNFVTASILVYGVVLPVKNKDVAGAIDHETPVNEYEEQGSDENVIQFPKNNDAQPGVSDSPFVSKDYVRKECDGRISEIETVMETTAEMVEISKKVFLSRLEISRYLSLELTEVDEFLKMYRIKKIFVTRNKKKWVVIRDDIDEKLGLD